MNTCQKTGIVSLSMLQASFYSDYDFAVAFSMWFGIIAAYSLGEAMNDRILILISKERNTRRPECYLHSPWIPIVTIIKIESGLPGVGHEYHLHYMTLAMGAFFVVSVVLPPFPHP